MRGSQQQKSEDRQGMIKTEHKGYTIEYDEERNSWHARDLDIKATSLKGVRKMIDDLDKAERRVKEIPVYKLDWNGSAEIMSITLNVDGTECWVKTKEGNRQKVKYADLLFVNDDTRSQLLQIKEARIRANEFTKRANELKDRLPRITFDQLRKLQAEDKK